MSKISVHPTAVATPVLALHGATATTNFEVRNSRGTLLFTSPDEDLAKTWLRDRAAQWPGAQVDEVMSWETRRRVYRPVAYLRSVK